MTLGWHPAEIGPQRSANYWLFIMWDSLLLSNYIKSNHKFMETTLAYMKAFGSNIYSRLQPIAKYVQYLVQMCEPHQQNIPS